MKSTIIIFTLALVSCITNAQQSQVDSAIALLNKSNIANGPDSLTFSSARQLIRTAILTDAQLKEIEKAAGQFKKGNDEDFSYAIKVNILESLSKTDKDKAIEYGKLNVQQLENSRTPMAYHFKQVFLRELRFPYRDSDKLQEGFQYFSEKLNESIKRNDSISISTCYLVLAGFYSTIGLPETAIYNMKKSLSYIDTVHEKTFNKQNIIGGVYGKRRWLNNASALSAYYIQAGDYEKANAHSKMILNISSGPAHVARFPAIVGLFTNHLDSVDYYLKIAEKNANTVDDAASLLQLRSLYNIKKGNLKEADSLLQQCWKLVNQNKILVFLPAGIIEPDYYMTLLRIEQKKYQEAIVLLLKDIERVKFVRLSVLRDYKLLADLYEKTGDHLKAKIFYKSFINLQDSILADQSKFRTIGFETEQQINENEIAILKLKSENKLSAQSRNFSIGIAALLLILAGSIYYRFHSKRKANKKLQKTLTELKSTQSQLIQQEKMASLGELTAGIAHEIQNPLNFVNNFSDVSNELLEEMKEELANGNAQLAIELAKDIKQNLEKILHHGKRADAIVKSMLQHSRTSSGQKEPADINALCDEYLRLAYHGLRAKDKSFNATTKTEFDNSIGKINVNPQDIGRVILNLINNAFYAVNEKLKQNLNGYEPTVIVSTKKEKDKIEIEVKDNGNGIPQKILDKIFQPFFTTKPTGQGTGLGLSLAYDIITKGHSGELKVETKEGEGSEFIISLPI